ncbi:MAG: helix-turn-helix transcriptional regulator [Clostridia bacterium]|nr:helix-turn-helix transcriptional regulator [Clostridia bacterium]
METVKYIRHPYRGKRITSELPDIFAKAMPPGSYYQDVLTVTGLSEHDVLIFTIGKNVYPPNVETSTAFQRWMVLYVVDGTMFCGKQQMGRGDFIIIPPSHSKNFHTKQNHATYYWCTTNDEEVARVLNLCGYSDEKIMVGHSDLVQDVVVEFEKTIYRTIKQCDIRVYLMARFSMIFAYLSANINKTSTTSDQTFKQCLNLIDGMQGNITVDYLAKHAFVSRRYLYSMFKEYKNMSPTEYITSVRMRVADDYLTSTDFSVSKIAELLGYADYTHFTRAYTKFFKIAPSKRRKQDMIDDKKR